MTGGDAEGERENQRVEYSDQKSRFEVIALPPEIREKYAFLEELPENVGVIGGMARSIARDVSTGEQEPIRDIDFVNRVWKSSAGS